MTASAARPRVSVFLAISLDGKIADDRHGLDWLEPFSTDSPEATGYAALMASCDALLMGRRTYDTVRAFEPWPYPHHPVFVLTHRPDGVQPHAQLVQGPVDEVLHRLGERGHRHVYLDGGDAVRQGLRAGCVDELTLAWVPVTLGRGVALWDELLPRAAWQPFATRALPSGLVQVRYARPEGRWAEAADPRATR